MVPAAGKFCLNLYGPLENLLRERDPLVRQRASISNRDVFVVVSRAVEHFEINDGTRGSFPGFDERS